MEVHGNVHFVAHRLADGGEAFGGLLHEAGRLDDARRSRAADAGLDGDEALGDRVLGVLDGLLGRASAGALVDLDAIAHRPAQHLVDRQPGSLARQIPHGMVDARERTGQDGAASVEGVLVDRLPMMHDPRRILADQRRLDLGDGLGHGQGPALQDRLTQADQAFIGVHFEKEPAGLDKNRFKSGDFHVKNLLSEF